MIREIPEARSAVGNVFTLADQRPEPMTQPTILNSIPVDWKVCADCFELELRLVQENGEDISVSAPRLPGVVSAGVDEADAIRNIRDAAKAVIRTYRDRDEPIPWRNDVKDPRTSEWRRWIVVNV